jgi:hypothetical protein
MREFAVSFDSFKAVPSREKPQPSPEPLDLDIQTTVTAN